MFISQLFILSPRGDKLVFKDYRQDAPGNSDEIFFRKYKFWDGRDHQAPASGDCPPFFLEKHIHFSFIKRSNLLFVCTSLQNVSPSLTSELLVRVVKVLKDFLGVISEESIRKNFVLVYELLDEMLDVGVAQELSTERLRPYIFNEVVPCAAPEVQPQESLLERIRRGDFTSVTTRKAEAALQSVVVSSAERKNEIYIDVIERLNVVFNANGGLVASEVDGAIIMKSFLAGSPDLILGVNEDLVVGRGDSQRTRYATVVLDSVNFHELADYSRFESDRILMMRPPDGEFTVMNYRVTGDITQPFRITPSIEVQSSFKAELTLRIRADFPSSTAALMVSVKVPVPKTTTSLGVEFGVGASGQSYEYKTADKYVVWTLQRFQGGTEHVCKIRFSTSAPITPATRKEVGPVSMSFEIPQHNVSGLSIKSLRLEERSQTYNPNRW
eukprot:CAMPEP_0176418010 /NCGR_PEP_ID=MMETSP0127-20121128/7213_1 /TAXON_ID=938130 /ORGANISM="Platyophrya macrostoma, Strain WH" /LENGTH=440 /DNA_ID=CAMNT_0017798247 /DNA_START=249 /DNA_END=1568 /DNA_ORIENTATION=-